MEHTKTAVCPPKDAKLWNQHPKVYFPFVNGQAICPYCKKVYQEFDILNSDASKH
jgi:uncharacterized Zn-finger protein